WAEDGLKYVVSAGLISGMQVDGRLCLAPQNMTTRAQTAVIFKGAAENYFCGDCEHEFSEAACAEAETCAKCGLVKGLAKGHRVTNYNCSTPAFCLDCGSAVAASKIFHSFADATCTAPRTCTLCGLTRGEALGHKWSAATCTVPKTCTVCNVTEGTPISHKGMNGICNYCGGEFFESFYDKAIYYIRQNGTYYAETNAYTVGNVNEYGGTTVSYYENDKVFAINNFYFYEDGYVDITQIQLKRGYNVYDYYYIFGNAERDIFYGFGRLDARTINSNTKESFSNYQGQLDSTYTDNLNIALQAMLGDASDLFARYCRVPLKDFGFKAY
ncbi:MAG: hypothetical protein IKU19_01890, partial [Clostridia bacterium]|nr:hypothetical protein [Clostridia bacterium]